MVKVKKPYKREIQLVKEWRAGFLSIPELRKKLKLKSKVGAYSTIARVYKYEYQKQYDE